MKPLTTHSSTNTVLNMSIREHSISPSCRFLRIKAENENLSLTTIIWLVNRHLQTRKTLHCRCKLTNICMGLCSPIFQFTAWYLRSGYFNQSLPSFIARRRKQCCTSCIYVIICYFFLMHAMFVWILYFFWRARTRAAAFLSPSFVAASKTSIPFHILVGCLQCTCACA